jgi:small multidrug resistance family-3 protein
MSLSVGREHRHRRHPRAAAPRTPSTRPARGRACAADLIGITRERRSAATIARSIALFAVAALFEIGGTWVVLRGNSRAQGWLWVGAGAVALDVYGPVAALQPSADFGRILAAYGGVFIAGSPAWGIVVDGFRPDCRDIAGTLICLVGVALLTYPRARTGPIQSGH